MTQGCIEQRDVREVLSRRGGVQLGCPSNIAPFFDHDRNLGETRNVLYRACKSRFVVSI